jgi:hypothetical protein
MPVIAWARNRFWIFILSCWRRLRFYVSELQDVCDVLAILQAKARTAPSVYEGSLCAVVNICNQVPLPVSERLPGFRQLTAFISRSSMKCSR